MRAAAAPTIASSTALQTPSSSTTTQRVVEGMIAPFRTSPGTAAAVETGLGAASGAGAVTEQELFGTSGMVGALAPILPAAAASALGKTPGINLAKKGFNWTKDFSKHTNDALYDMIGKVLNDDVDYNLNKEQCLFVSKTIDEFKKRIYKNVTVIGGGIFGCTTAWKLAKEGHNVTLYEQNDNIISQASNINQYRLHKGYHYPRSIETAQSSINGENTFLQEYGDSIINGNVEHYYCIAKQDSKVNAKQYWTFLNELNLPYQQKELDFIQENVVSLSVKVKEYLFNPTKLKEICWDKLNKHNVNVVLNSNVWNLEEDYIINATYANLNHLLPEDKQKDYQFELCEKPVVKLPKKYKNKSVVIMDGPFMCIDPLGDTGWHVMGNVVHAIHNTNTGKFPECDKKFDELLNKGIVENPSITNIDKFIDSAKKFFVDIDKVKHIGSMYTFRTVLPNRDNDDARPTLVEKTTDNIFSLFSGKIGTCVNAAEEIMEQI